jgi:Ca2+-binding RTX toxin-like protein
MATITFGSNNASVQGTPGDDSMVGNDPTGNVNDIIYGHQGADTITTTDGLFDSTVYGGQGNDSISDTDPTLTNFAGGNVIYGNFGNDSITSFGSFGDTIYGGQGDDLLVSSQFFSGTIYGNLGNDSIMAVTDRQDTFYGGQGNDTVRLRQGDSDVIYGNFGNDLLIGEIFTSNSHEYGGQGNDTLVFTGFERDTTFNDVETGGLGNDLFIATYGSGAIEPLEANDIVTVTDFLQGTDLLAESNDAGVPLAKIQGIGDNAAQALNDANSFYQNNNPGNAREYVFVYGGTGAGYLFYNGDFSSHFAQAGMAILGANGENSVMASDITTIPVNLQNITG